MKNQLHEFPKWIKKSTTRNSTNWSKNQPTSLESSEERRKLPKARWGQSRTAQPREVIPARVQKIADSTGGSLSQASQPDNTHAEHRAREDGRAAELLLALAAGSKIRLCSSRLPAGCIYRPPDCRTRGASAARARAPPTPTPRLPRRAPKPAPVYPYPAPTNHQQQPPFCPSVVQL